MRKKLMLFCMLIMSIFCISACKAVPYANMTITATWTEGAVSEETVIPLTISKIGESYDYGDPVEINIAVTDDKSETELTVEVSDGLGYVSVDKQYNGDGSTTLRVKPVSYEKTGKFALKVMTTEGNKSIDIHFNIDLTLNDFEFKSDSPDLKVIGKGNSLDLTGVDGFIKF